MAIYRFCDFELDAARFELHRAGRRLPAERRTLELLLHLLRNRTRVVPRADLLAALWPGVAVQDHIVNQVIYSARKLLGDDPRAPRFIETLRGRGFRFVAEVEEGAPRNFAGCAAELRALQGALEAARRGQGGAVLIGGRAGSGKTRLAGEFAARARAMGARVQRARCTEDSGAPALWPWRKLLRSERAALSAESWRGVLQRHPPIGQLLGDAADAAQRFPETDSGEFLIFEAIARYGAEASAEAPLVLILDDLHCADAASGKLLRYLALEAEDAAVLLVAMFRDGELAARSELRESLAGLLQRPRAQRLALGGFSTAEVVEFARAADPAMHRDEALRLGAYSGGNPAFLQQLLRSAPEPVGDGAALQKAPQVLRQALSLLDGAQGEPPAPREIPMAFGAGAPLLCEAPPVLSVQRALSAELCDVALAQLAALSGESREALACAAALGAGFDLALLAALLGESESRTAGWLAPALRVGLLRECGGSPARFTFEPALLRDALYNSLGPARRSALHERVVQALQSGVAGRAADEEIALHWMRAGRAPSPEELGHCERAAREAERRHEFTRLLPLARRAAELAALLAEPPERRSEALCRLGGALQCLGELAEARRVLSEAADWARRGESPAALAQVALQLAPVLSGMRPGQVNRQALNVLEDALAALPLEDTDNRALVASRLAQMLYWDFGAAPQREEALRLAEREAAQAGEPNRVTAQICCIAARWMPGERASRAGLSGLRRAAERLGLGESAFVAGVLGVMDRMEAADPVAVESAVAELRSAAAGLEIVQVRWLAALYAVSLALNKGNFEEALQRGARILHLGPGMVGPEMFRLFETILQLVVRFHGTGGFAAGGLDAALLELPRLRSQRISRAFMLLRMGRKSEALQTVIELIHELPGWPRNAGWLLSVVLLAEAVCELELREHAPALRALLHPHREALVVMGPAVPAWGAAARVLGRLAVLAGRAEEAGADFEIALRLETRCGLRPWLVHSRWHYGALLQSRAETALRGAEMQRQALELAELLGMQAPADN